MSDDDLAYKQELLEALKKQLREREFFAAELGVSADPVISKEINKIRVRITNIEQETDEYPSSLLHHSIFLVRYSIF